MKNSLIVLLLFANLVLSSCQKDFGDYPTYQKATFNWKTNTGRTYQAKITYWKEVKFNNKGLMDCGIDFSRCGCCPEVMRAIQNSNNSLIWVLPSYSYWLTNVTTETCIK